MLKFFYNEQSASQQRRVHAIAEAFNPWSREMKQGSLNEAGLHK